MNQSTLKSALTPQRWQAAKQQLLGKMIAEFMYEEIIKPNLIQDQGSAIATYELPLPESIAYRFQAKHRLFDSYHVFTDTIQRREGTTWETADNPMQFVLDIHTTVGMTGETTAHLIKELHNTLLADTHIKARQQQMQSDLTTLDYAQLEGEMEGHPWITFNKGRIGFGYDDYLAYAPEQKQPVNLAWIAVSNDRAQFEGVTNLEERDFLEQELGSETVSHFEAILQDYNVNPRQYHFLPVHDWQWQNVIISLFAEDIAHNRIIYLGRTNDTYLPQQSIRTFANISHPQKHHVKVPLSILNTLIYRGLPGARSAIAPKVTEWVTSIRDHDSFLRDEARLVLPGEVASINYNHPYYSQLTDAPYQYQEMLGCIWRESILSYMEPGEQPITLASLLHVDYRNQPFVSQLVDQSGLSLETWLDRLFNTVLPPLLHYLYQYGIAFSPHGENTILVLKDYAPHRLAMKDFVDDVNISRHPLPELQSLPDELRAVLLTEPPQGLCQFIWASLLICHHRYLAELLDTYHNYSEYKFWYQVRQAILNYQAKFPQLQDRFELFDLFAPTFTKLCLNRNRLITYGYADDNDRPHAAEYGTVNNALYAVANATALH